MRKVLLVISMVAVYAACDETKRDARSPGAGEAVNTAPAANTGAASTGAASTGATNTGATNTAEPVRDVLVIITAVDTAPLVGRSVDLKPIKVQKVVSDRVFTVGESADKAVYVMLDPSLDKGAAEQKIVVKPGQTVQLSGVIERAAGSEIAAAKARGLSDQEAQAMKDQKLFLLVKRIDFKG